jgi:hypothetical protein
MNVAGSLTEALGVPGVDDEAGDLGDKVAVVWRAVSTGEPTDAGIDAEIVGSTWRLNGEVDTVLWPERSRALLVVRAAVGWRTRSRPACYRIAADADGCIVRPRSLSPVKHGRCSSTASK